MCIEYYLDTLLALFDGRSQCGGDVIDVDFNIESSNDNEPSWEITKAYLYTDNGDGEINLYDSKYADILKIVEKRIDNFEELKKSSEITIKKENEIKNQQKTKKTEIMNHLKKLRIITDIK